MTATTAPPKEKTIVKRSFRSPKDDSIFIKAVFRAVQRMNERTEYIEDYYFEMKPAGLTCIVEGDERIDRKRFWKYINLYSF